MLALKSQLKNYNCLIKYKKYSMENRKMLFKRKPKIYSDRSQIYVYIGNFRQWHSINRINFQIFHRCFRFYLSCSRSYLKSFEIPDCLTLRRPCRHTCELKLKLSLLEEKNSDYLTQRLDKIYIS